MVACNHFDDEGMKKLMAQNCRFSLVFKDILAICCHMFVLVFALYVGVGVPGIFLIQNR